MAELEVHFPDGLVGFKKLEKSKPLVMGRSSDADVQLNFPGAGRTHCTVEWSDNRFRLSTTKGRTVELNGQSVETATLQPNDRIAVGDLEMFVRVKAGEIIYDSLELQFDPGALADVEKKGRSLSSSQPVGKGGQKAEEYYVPMWRSPLFIGITSGLAALCLIGLVLWMWVQSRGAQKQFDAAMKDLGDGLHAQAIRRFDRFVEDYPDHDFTDKAVVWRGLARVRQFVDGSAKDYRSAYESAALLEDDAADLHFFKQQSEEVARLLLSTSLGLAVSARDAVSHSDLDAARRSIKLTQRLLGKDALDQAKLEEIQRTIDEAEFVITKEDRRQATLTAMDRALEGSNASAAYDAHRELIARYPDLRSDEDCLDRRRRGRELETGQVAYKQADPSDTVYLETVETVPATSFVRYQTSAEAKPLGLVLPMMVGDTIYALDGGNGHVVWRTPVGYQPAFGPLLVPGDPTRMLSHGTADNSLILLETATGAEIWRLSLGERVLKWPTVPMVRRGRVFLPYTQGDDPNKGGILEVRLESGRVLGSYSFPQALGGWLTLDSRRDALFVLADQESMYDVDLRNRACDRTFGIGHEPGAILAAPVLAGRFIFLTECTKADTSRLRCLVIDDEDETLGDRQQEEISGWAWRPPVVAGGRLFLTTDRQQVYAFDLGGDTDRKPMTKALTPLGKVNEKLLPPYPIAVSDRELWTAAETLKCYEFQLGDSTAKASWDYELRGTPLAPPQTVSDLIVVASSDPQGGGAFVLGVDHKAKKVRWRSHLGVQPRAVQSDPSKPNSLSVLFESETIEFSDGQLANDSVTVLKSPDKTSDEAQQWVTYTTLREWTDGVVQWAMGHAQLLYFEPEKSARTVPLPSKVAAKPAVFGKGLLVGGADGLLYWIDPKTGTELGEPFAASYSEGQPPKIKSVTAVGETSAIAVANRQIVRLDLRDKPFVHFYQAGQSELPEASENQLVTLKDRVLLTHGNELLSLQPKTLEILDRWTLGAEVGRPAVVSGTRTLFVTNANDVVCAAGSTGQVDIEWRWKLPSEPVGAPVPGKQSLWLATSDGTLFEHSLEDDVVLQKRQVGRAVVSGPWLVGNHLVVATPDGSLAAVPLKSSE